MTDELVKIILGTGAIALSWMLSMAIVCIADLTRQIAKLEEQEKQSKQSHD